MVRILVLGGVGFIGRHLVYFLVENPSVSKVAVVDKAIPEISGMSAKELAYFKNEKVIYKQANLSRQSSVDAAFALDGGSWDHVVNLAALTKYGMLTESYQDNVEIAKLTSITAKNNGVKKYIYMSTAQVYESGKSSSDENSKLKPWTIMAKNSLKAEEEVINSGIPYIILRPAIVYGVGDVTGLTPRLIIGAVYKKLNEKMELLWDKQLKLNTVHVKDVVAAIWFLLCNQTVNEIYNLADSADSDQNSISSLVSKIFNINYDFVGTVKSNIYTAVSMKIVADTANEKHLKPWSQLLKETNINDSPLTPYLDEELLHKNSLSVDGTKIVSLGFKYSVPEPTVENLKSIILDFEEKNFFPKGLIV